MPKSLLLGANRIRNICAVSNGNANVIGYIVGFIGPNPAPSQLGRGTCFLPL
jgi:hypothetical protein